MGRADCALPKPHCKQVSHLHIVEGALPLTEIAFAILLSLFGFLFDVYSYLNGLFFRIDTLEFKMLGRVGCTLPKPHASR